MALGGQNSNLPPGSQKWVIQVEKRITALEKKVKILESQQKGKK